MWRKPHEATNAACKQGTVPSGPKGWRLVQLEIAGTSSITAVVCDWQKKYVHPF